MEQENKKINIIYQASGQSFENKREYDIFPSFIKNDKTQNKEIIALQSANNDTEIEIQEFYDGSNNIIINDENNLRIINSGFAVNDDYQLIPIKRNNKYPTNKYTSENVDLYSSLVLTATKPPKIDFEVDKGGNLIGGNYFFYIKYGTADGDATDIVEETRAISIFHGDLDDPKTVSGPVGDERTDKSIRFTISNLDNNFSKLYLYYSRASCDSTGIKVIKSYKIVKGYNIQDLLDETNSINILVTGNEETEEIDTEELNIDYIIPRSVRTIAQNQGMLFVANLKTDNIVFDKNLENIAQNNVTLNVTVEQFDDNETLDWNYKGTEYYNAKNISKRTGYWNNDFYRFGIVYVYQNGKCSCVYNLKGGILTDIKSSDRNFDNSKLFENNDGVFYIHVNSLYNSKSTNDNYLSVTAQVELTQNDRLYLKSQNIISYFIVRQTRIPINLFQGVINAVENRSGFPCLRFYGPTFYNKDYNAGAFQFKLNKNQERDWVESFLHHALDYYNGEGKQWPISNKGDNVTDPVNSLSNNTKWFLKLIAMDGVDDKQYVDSDITHRGILSLDPYCVYQLQSLLSGNNYYLQPEYRYENNIVVTDNQSAGLSRKVQPETIKFIDTNKSIKVPLVYVPQETSSLVYNQLTFSTKAGSAENVLDVSYIDQVEKVRNNKKNGAILRGTATPFVGIGEYSDDVKKTLVPNTLVTVRTCPQIYIQDTTDYKDDINEIATFIDAELSKRKQDNSSFSAITERHSIESISENISQSDTVLLAGGDCFINVVTLRMQTNFIDPDTQINDTIVKENTWTEEYKGINQDESTNPSNINRSDVNASQIGTWYTFKCRSNYNLGLRSEDKSNADEINKMGNWRSFYPKRDINPKAAGKVPDSNLLNLGLSTVLSERRYYNFTSEDFPYDNTDYSCRVMFSNVYTQGSFENGYRIFQGLSYRDYSREYGSITKIISIGQTLFVVFEHGCGILPINEKALLSTTEGQSIHMYGAGVLPEQMTMISQQYGSTWKSSVILTNSGVYGVDTHNKVIWRYNTTGGFTLLSNLQVSKFLNENIKFKDDIAMLDSKVLNGLQQVRTHYNKYKLDIMFTFSYYPDEDSKTQNIWNLCYNERLERFVCKYTWTPYLSETIADTLYTFNLKDNNLIAIAKAWKNNSNEELNHEVQLWQHTRSSNPTKWYGEQAPFEFEFIVNTPIGLHKVFDNLVIISNNVEPESLDIDIIGDVYMFDKANIFEHSDDKTFPKINLAKVGENQYLQTYTTVKELGNTKEYKLRVHQDLLNIKKYGRRLGNIHYTEDKWNVVLPQIFYNKNGLQSTRLRDKYARVRIKYNGKQRVIITAIQTLLRLSYS